MNNQPIGSTTNFNLHSTKPKFKQELKDVINRHSMENGSNTPDFILAEYLLACLEAFDKATRERSALLLQE